MISVDKALSLLANHRPDWGVTEIAVTQSCGHKLAQDVVASFDQPRSDVSVMDGYALHKNCVQDTLIVIGESRAGEPFPNKLLPGQAVRIFTGALMPIGADYVEIQEHAICEGDILTFHTQSKNRTYIRKAGADFKRGETICKSGTLITPATVLALATANIDKVKVLRKPIIGVLRCGDELRPVGSKLSASTITDSIGPSLLALLKCWGYKTTDLGICVDDPNAIKEKVRESCADIIVTIGGASVGKYDFMQTAFSELGYNSVFSKLSVKPGKPTWFATKGKTCVLGLPGNPSSIWVCVHIFLNALLGRDLKWTECVTHADIPSNGNRETFLRGELTPDGKIHLLPNQDSGLTLPITRANILIRRNINAPMLRKGATVTCLRLT